MTTLWLTQELTGSILDVGGGGEGIIGRRYGSAVTVIDNRQEELDEAPCSCRKLRMDAASLAFADASFENVTFLLPDVHEPSRAESRPCRGRPGAETRRQAAPLGLRDRLRLSRALSGRAGRSLGAGTNLHHLRRCKIRPAIHGRFPEPVPGKRIDAFESGNRQRTFLSGISEIKNRRACFFQQTRL